MRDAYRERAAAFQVAVPTRRRPAVVHGLAVVRLQCEEDFHRQADRAVPAIHAAQTDKPRAQKILRRTRNRKRPDGAFSRLPGAVASEIAFD